jgi:hypothetical protein
LNTDTLRRKRYGPKNTWCLFERKRHTVCEVAEERKQTDAEQFLRNQPAQTIESCGFSLCHPYVSVSIDKNVNMDYDGMFLNNKVKARFWVPMHSVAFSRIRNRPFFLKKQNPGGRMKKQSFGFGLLLLGVFSADVALAAKPWTPWMMVTPQGDGSMELLVTKAGQERIGKIQDRHGKLVEICSGNVCLSADNERYFFEQFERVRWVFSDGKIVRFPLKRIPMMEDIVRESAGDAQAFCPTDNNSNTEQPSPSKPVCPTPDTPPAQSVAIPAFGEVGCVAKDDPYFMTRRGSSFGKPNLYSADLSLRFMGVGDGVATLCIEHGRRMAGDGFVVSVGYEGKNRYFVPANTKKGKGTVVSVPVPSGGSLRERPHIVVNGIFRRNEKYLVAGQSGINNHTLSGQLGGLVPTEAQPLSDDMAEAMGNPKSLQPYRLRELGGLDVNFVSMTISARFASSGYYVHPAANGRACDGIFWNVGYSPEGHVPTWAIRTGCADADVENGIAVNESEFYRMYGAYTFVIDEDRDRYIVSSAATLDGWTNLRTSK